MPQPRVLVVEHEAGDDAGLVGEWLRAAGVQLDVRRGYDGDEVPERLDADGLLVLGGAVSAYDDERAPWLPATRSLLAAAAAADRPTLAVCLGAQLLARACGGRVELDAAAGIEVGVAEVRPLPAAAADPLLAGSPGPLPAVQYHTDAVAELPPGAVRLAAGDRYPNQAFRIGDRVWGVQFHPEVTTETFATWVRGGARELRAGGLDPEELVADAARHAAVLAATWRPVIERFAGVVAESR